MHIYKEKKGPFYCHFKFSTISCENLNQQKKKKPDIVKVDYSAKDKLKGECFTKREGYWDYRICIGDKIRQYHGSEDYILGHYNPAKDESDTQTYDEGTVCNPQMKIKRSTRVKFMCGNQRQFVSISEPTTCHYEVTVTDPALCGPGSPFQKYSGPLTPQPTALASPFDHWFMSLEKVISAYFTVNIVDC